MLKENIRAIVDAACETVDSIVGARAWKPEEDANAMHDVIFWEMLVKQLPDYTIAEILELQDDGAQPAKSRAE